MKIVEKDIREEFRITDQNIIIDDKRKEETLLYLQEEIAGKQTRVLSNRKEILLQQFWYMDKFMIGIDRKSVV